MRVFLSLFLVVGVLSCGAPSQKHEENREHEVSMPVIDSVGLEKFRLDSVSVLKEEIKDSASTATSDTVAEVTVPVIEKAPEKKKSKTPRKKKPVKRPKIVFASTDYDFGEITEGDIIKFDFNFVNEGNGILQVTNAKGSCGCARPSFPFLDIAPGEGGRIGVTYNSVGKDGPQDAFITITTNQKPSQIVLDLKGIVTPKPVAAN